MIGTPYPRLFLPSIDPCWGPVRFPHWESSFCLWALFPLQIWPHWSCVHTDHTEWPLSQLLWNAEFLQKEILKVRNHLQYQSFKPIFDDWDLYSEIFGDFVLSDKHSDNNHGNNLRIIHTLDNFGNFQSSPWDSSDCKICYTLENFPMNVNSKSIQPCRMNLFQIVFHQNFV